MNKTLRHVRQARQHGVTLIESAVVTAVVAMAAGSVVPGLTGLRSQHELAQAASTFETDVLHTRSMAVSLQATLRISFSTTDSQACYIVHATPAGDCRCDGAGPAVCDSGEAAYRTVHFPATGKVVLKSNVASIGFDPVKGTSTPAGTVRFTAPDGRAVQQIVNIMGRVRACSPARSVTGYKAC